MKKNYNFTKTKKVSVKPTILGLWSDKPIITNKYIETKKVQYSNKKDAI